MLVAWAMWIIGRQRDYEGGRKRKNRKGSRRGIEGSEVFRVNESHSFHRNRFLRGECIFSLHPHQLTSIKGAATIHTTYQVEQFCYSELYYHRIVIENETEIFRRQVTFPLIFRVY